jgi:hypothetical protein
MMVVEGTNTLAVEVHQITQFSSTDLSFDCELAAFLTDDAARLTAARRDGQLEFGGRLDGPVETFFDPEPLRANSLDSGGEFRRERLGRMAVRVPSGGRPPYFRLQAP